MTETTLSPAVEPQVEKEKEIFYNIKLGPEEIEVVDRIITSGEFTGLEITRRSMVRYIILKYAETVNKGVAHERDISRLRADIADIRNYMDFDTVRTKDLMIALVGSKGMQIPTSPRKPKPARTVEEGTAVCNVLGGTIQGDMCKYTMYKIMPSGAAVDYEVTTPLEELTEVSVSEQYSPSKEKFEEARIKTKGVV
jgi:hypothetical protein